MQNKTSNNAMRCHPKTEDAFWQLVRKTCPEPNSFFKVLSQRVLEVASALHGRLYSVKTRQSKYSHQAHSQQAKNVIF